MGRRKPAGHLYDVFAVYRDSGYKFCTRCYSPEEIEYLKSSPVRAIERRMAGKLLREAMDHWDSPRVYKHYLPRLLDVLALPDAIDDLYPEHLFEVLRHHGFSSWPTVEKRSILDYLEALTAHRESSDAVDYDEWAAGIASIRGE